MRKRVIPIAAASSMLGFVLGAGQPALATNVPTQKFTVHVAADVSAPWLDRSEQAIESQSQIVRERWDTPLVRFGSGGWPVYLRSSDNPDGRAGWHGAANGHPYAVVETNAPEPAAAIFDHEVLETLVDPYGKRFIDGRLAEICDPVVGHRYRASNGALLVDWVYPSYFRDSAAGPWDYLHVLTGGA